MTNYKRFRGEIENYLKGSQGYFESRIDSAFNSLRFGTWLSRSNKRNKKDKLFFCKPLTINVLSQFCPVRSVINVLQNSVPFVPFIKVL